MGRKKVLDVYDFLSPDGLAEEIANKWQTWDSAREQKKKEWRELRNYVYATDTRTTSNSVLPWSNSTTTPKITQIRDNLHANYFAALFPNRNWMSWVAGDKESANIEKAKVVKSYLKTKIESSDFLLIMEDLLDDWILYGNAFAQVIYERDVSKVGDETISQYVGPALRRISPYDIVFNPLASTFHDSPKIIRKHFSLGDVRKNWPVMFEKIMKNRGRLKEASNVYDTSKHNAYTADGFANLNEYYGSEVVECLTFYGDIYDNNTKELKENVEVKVIDRAYVLEEKKMETWLKGFNLHHIGWRNRPDNLWGMGPLDNLVGLQYRLDHLENLKADIFDQIALPMLKVVGEVEDFEHQPGERIYIGEEGDVSYLNPETTALQADFQIDVLTQRMEEMAGAPKEAMGLRTPGEKTAFEVETLASGANRIFKHKAEHFERKFVEPILNSMLETGRRNLDGVDNIRSLDTTTGAVAFQTIEKEDITARGNIVPIGARHFAEKNQRVRELDNLLQRKVADPSVGQHLSGKKIAQLLAEEIGEGDLFGENVAISEQMETQMFAEEVQSLAMEQRQVET